MQLISMVFPATRFLQPPRLTPGFKPEPLSAMGPIIRRPHLADKFIGPLYAGGGPYMLVFEISSVMLMWMFVGTCTCCVGLQVHTALLSDPESLCLAP